ncbi:MAG: DUF1533 domain-containing protein, partial [Bacilli bacterium]|nr:DUF1533 domain-containing protein [Bacilli bacterium]
AHSVGNATVTVDNGTDMKSINVVVDNGEIDSNIEFNKDGVYSGNWLTTSNGLKGIQQGGDGFILSKDKYTNFTYTATIDLTNAVAGGLLFRAKDDMSSYFMANYDKGAQITKLWNEKRELGSAHIEIANLSAVNIAVYAENKNIKVAINGNKLIDVVINDDDDEAMEGKLGLNVCAGSALFKGINTIKDEYDFNNEDLVIYSPATQFITSLVNVSKNNQNVVRGNYEVDGNKLIISKSYFLTLESNTLYKFMAYGSIANFEFSVNTGEIEREGDVIEATITEGQNFNIYVGNIAINKVTLDGNVLTTDDYFVSGTVLVIKASVLKAGTHQIIINDKYVINLNTKPVSTDVVTDVVDKQLPVYVPILITLGSIALATGLAFGVYFVVVALRKKKYTWKK